MSPPPISLADHEAHARTVLDDNAWAYFAGGAADEITLRANRDAWKALWLQPRVLRPLSHGHTRVELFGRTLAHPLLLAPVAFQRLAHPLGELGSTLAAAPRGTQANPSEGTSTTSVVENSGASAEPCANCVRSGMVAACVIIFRLKSSQGRPLPSEIGRAHV